MIFKKNNSNEIMIDRLLNVRCNRTLRDRITKLQNEIGVLFDEKVIAVTSINSDMLTAAFSKAFADVFLTNNSNCLIIDANLYNPCLEILLMRHDLEYNPTIDRNNLYSSNIVKYGVSSISIHRNTYPSSIFKSGLIQKIVSEQLSNFEHILIIAPPIGNYKEISLLKDIIQAILVISEQNITTKQQIYNACSFLNKENLPLAKVLVLKK